MKSRPAAWSSPCASLLILVSLALSTTAAAQELAILGLSSKDGDDEPAAHLTNALRAEAAKDADVRLSDSTALLSQLLVLHDCEIGDAACRDSIAAQLQVDVLIYGSIRSGTFGHVVELHRYVKADGDLSHASREITIEGASEEDLAGDARSLLRELREEDVPEPAAVETEPAPEPERPPMVSREPREAEDGASSNDWLGYTLLGVAAVSTGLTLYSWNEIDEAKNNATFREYREAIGRAEGGAMIDDVCAEADDGEAYGLGERLENVRGACGRGETFEILQWVFMGSALVSAGFGIYVLLDDEGEPDAARASLTPVLGRGDAGFNLRFQM